MPFVGLPRMAGGQWPWIVVACAPVDRRQPAVRLGLCARPRRAISRSTEYSGFLWAAALGWLIFREPVSLYTLAGAVLIVGGCLVAARGKVTDPPELDVAA